MARQIEAIAYIPSERARVARAPVISRSLVEYGTFVGSAAGS
jgi:hypothetical protein